MSVREIGIRNNLASVMEDLVKFSMGWDDDKAYFWMVTPNPNFGGSSPYNLILCGRSHKVLAFIENAITENKPLEVE